MSGLFVFLLLLALILLAVSVLKPSIINRFIKKSFSRKQLALIFSSLIIVFFVLFGITAPPTTNSPKAEVKGDKVEQQTEQTNQLPVISPEPTEIATPTPSPSPKPTPTLKPTANPSPKPSPTPTITPTTQYVAPTTSNCNPSYPDVCIPNGAADYDCEEGNGNGPNYIQGPIRVLPPDPYDLDRNHDGVGCES